MKERSKIVLILLTALTAVSVGVLSGLGLYTFLYARGYSYLLDDPRACANCHIMQDHYDSWVKASHRAAATCNDCHLPHVFPGKYIAKMLNGWNHSKAFTLQNFPEPIRITPGNLRITEENCLRCHGDFVAELTPCPRENPDERRCSRCHASTGHMALST